MTFGHGKINYANYANYANYDHARAFLMSLESVHDSQNREIRALEIVCESFKGDPLLIGETHRKKIFMSAAKMLYRAQQMLYRAQQMLYKYNIRAGR